MKRNCTVSLLLALLVLGATGCTEHHEHGGEHHEEALSEGVLGLTGSVRQQVVASSPVVYADSGSRIFEARWQGRIGYDTRQQRSLSSRVAGRIERLHVRYNFEPVKKGQLVMEVYSPDLVAAQRELLFLAREGQSHLHQSTIQKLIYMGMTRAQIDRVLASGEPLYRVGVFSPVSGFIAERKASDQLMADPRVLGLREGQYVAAGEPLLSIYRNESVVAEFSLNPEQVYGLRSGQSILFPGKTEGKSPVQAKVAFAEPVIRNGESFTIARVYLPSGSYAIGELVEASVPMVIKEGSWLPESAVVDLGGESAVFLRKGNVYSPERVVTALRIDGMVQILSDLSGRPVARDAAYLVDSESFIQAKN
jgi:Cu(I)/Ag(I) efflux system membrane fusion protein